MIAGLTVVRNKLARRCKLSVNAVHGTVRLVVPPRVRLADALGWAEQHREWIAEQRERLPRPRPFVAGATVPFGDELLTIDWREERPRRVQRVDGSLVCGGPAEGLSRRIEAWLKREALATLSRETADVAARIGVAVRQVAVGDARGRWGSCSGDGVIRYSWRLILAPAFVRRSTVAHEVAHRVHLDHSPRFHRLAAELEDRDPAESRAWLARNGAALHWIGRAAPEA